MQHPSYNYCHLPGYLIAVDQTADNLAPSFFDMLSIGERAVLGPEEDTITLAVAAGEVALQRAGLEPEEIGAVFLGTGTNR
mgnify:CR=1 FL=1